MTTFRSYPLLVEHHPDEGGYLAFFPTLPGCQTWADSFEEAVQGAEEALAVYVETLLANGDPLPEPGPSGRQTTLGVIVRLEPAA